MNKIEIFEIKEEHLKLLRQAHVSWNDCEFGAPSIDCKRPYGNSYVEDDIAKIFGWKMDDGELSDEQFQSAYKIHRELETVLQICLSLGKFEAGIYIKGDEYKTLSWKEFKGSCYLNDFD